MFVRVTTSQATPGKADEAVRLIKKDVLPAAKAMPGFKGGVWTIDRATGKGVTVTFFESEAALKASDAAAQKIRTKVVGELGARVISVERYEVIATAGAADSLA